MTREEAIKEITRAYDVLDFSCHMDNHRKEAFNMAKVALEQEPVYFPPCVDCNTKMNEIREAYDKLKEQEPCDDAVSRQTMFKWLESWKEQNRYYHPYTKNKEIPMCEVVDMIQSAPAVTPTCKEPSEWQQDHAILKAHSDGASEVVDRIKALRGDVSVLREERRTIECHCGCASDIADEVLELIDKLIAEVEG